MIRTPWGSSTVRASHSGWRASRRGRELAEPRAVERPVQGGQLGQGLQDLRLGGQFAVDAGGQHRDAVQRLLLHRLLLLR